MSDPEKSEIKPNPPPSLNPNLLRDRLANERTFLAWLRTGIAITSLGFVVARFDIFLQELTRATGQPAARSQAAIPIGVILVLAGPVLILIAAARFLETERALLAGLGESRRLVRTVILGMTIIALLAGFVLALHLLANWPD